MPKTNLSNHPEATLSGVLATAARRRRRCLHRGQLGASVQKNENTATQLARWYTAAADFPK
jgi:hypothetical protein